MLTIEELKNLQIGDWIWRIFPNAVGFSTYIQKMEYNDNYFYKSRYKEAECRLNYSTYGTEWIAFKNKEEVEGKSITLPYLLCTSNKFACVIWQDKDGKVKKTYTMPIEEAKGVLKEKDKLCNTND